MTIMSAYLSQNYQRFLKQQLKELSPIVVSDIRSIISDQANIPGARLEVMIYSGSLDQSLPITASLYHNIYKIKTWKIANLVENVLSPAQLAVLQTYHQAGVEITELTLQALIEWFADCWQQASNGSKQLAARISIHDDIEAFDLNHGKWIQKETQ
jgi:hypothetical protein